MHTIQITEDLYRRLSEQAAQLHITPEQMLERLLAAPSIDEGDEATPVPPAGSEEALAAVPAAHWSLRRCGAPRSRRRPGRPADCPRQQRPR